MLSSKHVGFYANVASLTVWAANYFETLELEIAYIWPLKFTLVDVLVVILRYIAPVQLIIALFLGPSTPWSSAELCHQQFLAFVGISFVGMRCAEALLFIRTYAIVGKTPRWKWYLIFHFFVVTAIPIWIVVQNQMQVTFFQPPGPVLGCGLPLPKDPTNTKEIPVVVVWAMIMANELAMMMIALYKGYTTYRHSRSPIVETLYKNGALYFFAASAVTAANIAVAVKVPEKAFFMSTLQHTLHTICASNMILTIRSQGGDRLPSQSGAEVHRLSTYRADTGRGMAPSILAKFRVVNPSPRPPSFIVAHVSTETKSHWR